MGRILPLGGVVVEKAGQLAATVRQEESVRERLLRAAAELFARKGYAATSVHEIVAACGVTKPVLYYYFGSKEGLFLQLMGEALQLFEATIAGALSREGSVRERICRLLEEVFALILSNLELARMAHALYFGPTQDAPLFDLEAFHQRLREVVRGLVAEGQLSGELRRSDPEAMAVALLGALDIAEGIALCHPQWGFGREQLAKVLEVIFEGAQAAPGQEA